MDSFAGSEGDDGILIHQVPGSCARASVDDSTAAGSCSGPEGDDRPAKPLSQPVSIRDSVPRGFVTDKSRGRPRSDPAASPRCRGLLDYNKGGLCLNVDDLVLDPAAAPRSFPPLSEAARSSCLVADAPSLPERGDALSESLSGGIAPDEVSKDSSSASILPSANYLSEGVPAGGSWGEMRCPVLPLSSDCGLVSASVLSPEGSGPLLPPRCHLPISGFLSPGHCSLSPVHGRSDVLPVGVASVPSVPQHLFSCSNFEPSESSFPPLPNQRQDSASPPVPTSSAPLTCLPVGASDPNCSTRPTWASLVKGDSARLQLKFLKPSSTADEGKLRIKLPPSVAQYGATIWKSTLVGFFLTRLPFSLVQASAQRLWGKFGLTEVLVMGEDSSSSNSRTQPD